MRHAVRLRNGHVPPVERGRVPLLLVRLVSGKWRFSNRGLRPGAVPRLRSARVLRQRFLSTAASGSSIGIVVPRPGRLFCWIVPHGLGVSLANTIAHAVVVGRYLHLQSVPLMKVAL